MGSKELAIALYWARLKKGLSLRAAAAKMGLDPRTISSVEKGKSWPQGKTMEKLKEFYPGILDDLV